MWQDTIELVNERESLRRTIAAVQGRPRNSGMDYWQRRARLAERRLARIRTYIERLEGNGR